MGGREAGCLAIIPLRALGVENTVRAPRGKGPRSDPRGLGPGLPLLIPAGTGLPLCFPPLPPSCLARPRPAGLSALLLLPGVSEPTRLPACLSVPAPGLPGTQSPHSLWTLGAGRSPSGFPVLSPSLRLASPRGLCLLSLCLCCLCLHPSLYFFVSESLSRHPLPCPALPPPGALSLGFPICPLPPPDTDR